MSVRLQEWERWAVKPVAPGMSLPEHLTERYKDLNPAPTVEQWLQWGEVLLCWTGWTKSLVISPSKLRGKLH